MDNIDDILNRYFDGISTNGEEKTVKEYFRSNQIAPKHEIYKPLFALFEKEKESITAPRFVIPKTKEKREQRTLRNLRIALTGVAAVILLGAILFPFKSGNETADDYVVIMNGERITDPKKAKAYAETMFTQACEIKKEYLQSIEKANEIQEKFNATRIIGEAKKLNEIKTTSNQ